MIRLLLLAAVLFAPATARAAWQQASSPHFVVYADDDPAVVRAFTERLERFDQAMRAMRNVPDQLPSPLARVSVYVVRSVGAVQKLAGRGAGDVAGFYLPRSSGSVAFVPRRSGDDALTAEAILLHEYAHHFMYSNWGEVTFPAWLVEGFAEFNATARFDPDGGVQFGAPPLYRVYGLLDFDLVPLKRLLTADPNHLGPEERQVFYARGWLLLHYMTADAERRKALGAYFAAVNQGHSPAEAAALLGDSRKLDLQLNAYIKQQSLRAFLVRADRLHVPPIEVRALSPAEVAIMPARIASVRGVDRKSAQGVVALARAVAAPFPTDPAAQNELAEAEYDAGDFAASQAAAARALAADPHSVHAMVYAGMSRAAQLRAARSTDAAGWQEVRGWYSRANHADPEYAYPLALYYGSFDGEAAKPTANALEGLLYARALAPYDADLGLTAAHILLERGKAEEAETILKPIAYNPHEAGYAAAAQGLIDAVNKGGAAGGLALWEERRREAEAATRATDKEGTGAAPLAH